MYYLTIKNANYGNKSHTGAIKFLKALEVKKKIWYNDFN